LNQAELTNFSEMLPELSQIRQQQIDWCLSRITRLELSYDCSAKRVSGLDSVKGPASITSRQSRPVADFEMQLFGLTTDAISTWSEYWEQIIQSASESICDSIARDSHSIMGMFLPAASAISHSSYFSLTGTPADKPVILSISCKPGLGFKPIAKTDTSLPAIKVKPYLEVGHTSVPVDRFEQMQPGGLLVLREIVDNGVLSNARVLLAQEQYVFAVSWNLEEGTILVTDTQLSASEGSNTQMNDDVAGGMAIPIYAQMELQSVDLDKLKALREEDTLDAGVLPKDAVVKLSAGGVAFGEGLLIQIDGRLAVRITKLNRRSI
jgi:flagellar motor switch/type III secretory pathway protein FliN